MLATMLEWGGLKLGKEDFSVIDGDGKLNLQESFDIISSVADKSDFEFCKESEDNPYVLMFMNNEEKFVMEVNMLTFAFKLIYAHSLMSGFLDTGWHEDITKEGLLDQVMIEFKEPVSILRKYYEKG